MIPRLAAGLGALVLVGTGLWALIDPSSFYDQLAEWPPYNEHFLHDVGAFQIGLGAALAFALVWGDALFVALAGVGVGAVLHTVAHAVDHGEGGSDNDPINLGIFAAVLLAGAALRWRERGRAATASDPGR
jgi:hypothetical protein